MWKVDTQIDYACLRMNNFKTEEKKQENEGRRMYIQVALTINVTNNFIKYRSTENMYTLSLIYHFIIKPMQLKLK